MYKPKAFKQRIQNSTHILLQGTKFTKYMSHCPCFFYVCCNLRVVVKKNFYVLQLLNVLKVITLSI